MAPGEAMKPATRLTTYMDDRTVVPSGVSEAPPLDGKSSIPAHMPLDVLVSRTLVARGMAVKQLERFERTSETASLALHESRTVVPAYVEALTEEELATPEHAPEMTAGLREIVEPDIFNTGDANLLIEPEETRDSKWDLMTRVLSIAVHIGIIIFLIFSPKIFPTHVPTQEETDIARRQLTYLLPPEIPSTPRPSTPPVHIDRRTLNRVAPPIEEPKIPTPEPPAPVAPPKPAPELPDSPRPQPAPTPNTPQPSRLEPVLPPTPQSPNHLNLQLPSGSPGAELQTQLQTAIQRSDHSSQTYGGGPAIPGARGGPGMGQGAEILSDTQGVDFTSYIQRLLATLKRNWETVMPESALMGDRGMVFTTFSINPDGSVHAPDPELERTSGKTPLDNAAISAIHASNPFEPLPSEFHGPYLKLRIVFDYNIPLDQVDMH